ncbi:LysR family transcriptional regulator [Amycolatopsis rhizosphaerae]|uniref:LysR family transcriptional regulator n=1 Tax=Amycolatopsis rhizosphaerae TaxID=2053003 RepID=A0A558DGQ5_9PSEU|nr:LysR family transcriptional regulator [Amycolatopsis rhizosphaerae]TVT60206.1 LysR family transcriptional regulator [Amycolatopsis rhizosphaerae]
MQFQQLAYFLSVAQTRHFTRAAEAQNVAQPSLSKQIQALETELGAALFSRARGNITLTPAGEALLPLANRILADVDTARLEVQEIVGLRRGRVRLGATPSLCSGLLADALRNFHDVYPAIRLMVEEGGSRDLVRDLTRGALDLALVILPLADDTPLATNPILRENLVVATPVDDTSLPTRAHLRITDLRDRPMVMFRQGYDLREATIAACRHAGFEPRFAVEGGEMDAVLRFVEVGIGVAVVPSMVLVGRPGLRGIPLSLDGGRKPHSLHRTVALAHRKDVTPTHATAAFRAVLESFIVDVAANGSLPAGVESLLATAPGDAGHPSARSITPLPSSDAHCDHGV